MKELTEAWTLLRIAGAVEEPELRRHLIVSHWRLVVAYWHQLRFERSVPLPELLVASGAIS